MTTFALTPLPLLRISSPSPMLALFLKKKNKTQLMTPSFPCYPNHLHLQFQFQFQFQFQQSTISLFTPFSISQRNADSNYLDDDDEEEEEEESSSAFSLSRPCEVYVCNLPRSLGIPHLLQLFSPYGTVQSVQVSRNLETGLSRGCGYVTMSSLKEAKAAIYALDGSDVDGREMRVKFSVDMDRSGRNLDALNSPVRKELIFESPYKMYVGNLIWAVKPKDLRNLFSQFGTVVSARVLHDRRGGKKRVYGFVSFSEAAELAAALSLNGMDYYGRNMLLREVTKQSDT